MRLCAWVCFLITLAGCGKPSAAPPVRPASGPTNGAVTNARPAWVPGDPHLSHAQTNLKRMKIQLGARELEVELAVSATEVATGMMFRTNMTDSEGMLFLFAGGRQQSYYMKNCVVPLSAAYIDVNGVIDQIVDLHPGVLEGVPSRSAKIKYVLEVPQGWFQRQGVPVGTVITTERGPLSRFSGVLQ